MNFLEIFKILYSKKLLLLFWSSLIAILCFVMGKQIASFETEGTLVILPQEAGNQRFLSQPAMGLFYSPQPTFLKESGRSYLTAIKSHTVIKEVLNRLNTEMVTTGLDGPAKTSGGSRLKNFLRVVFYGSLPSAPRTQEDRELQKISNSIQPDLLASSTMIRLRVRDRDPFRAQKIANTTMEVFVNFGESKAKERAGSMAELLQAQAEEVRKQLAELRQQEKVLKKQTGLLITSDIDTEQTRISAKIQTARDQIRDDADTVLLDQERLKVIESLLAEIPEYQRLTYALERNASMKSLEDQLMQLRLDLVAQQLDYLPESQRITATKRRISQIESELKNHEDLVIRQESFSLDKTHQALISERLGIKRQMKLGPKEIKLLQLRVEEWTNELYRLENTRTQFEQLEKQIALLSQRDAQLLTDAEFNRGLTRATFREIEILNYASLPPYPDIRGFPLIVFVVLGGGVGFVLLSSIVIYRYHILNTEHRKLDEDTA